MSYDESTAAVKDLVDESLVPFHERLIKIHSSLSALVSPTHGIVDDVRILQELQQDLNRLENGKSYF